MTLDRDVRLTPTQIGYLADAVRRRRHELRRKIDKAHENARAGATIQHGTLDRHVAELEQLMLIADVLEVARQQIIHQMKRQIGESTKPHIRTIQDEH